MKKNRTVKKSSKSLPKKRFGFLAVAIILVVVASLLFVGYKYLTQPAVIAGVMDDYTYNLGQKAAGVTGYVTNNSNDKGKTKGQIQVEAQKTLESIAKTTNDVEIKNRAVKAKKDVDTEIAKGTKSIITQEDIKKATEKVAADDKKVAEAVVAVAAKTSTVTTAAGSTCDTQGSPVNKGDWVMTGGASTDANGKSEYMCVQCNPQDNGKMYDTSKAKSCGQLLADGQSVVLGFDMDPTLLGLPKDYKLGSCFSNAGGSWVQVGVGGKDAGGNYCSPDGKLYSEKDKGKFDDAMNVLCSTQNKDLKYESGKCQSVSAISDQGGTGITCGKGFTVDGNGCKQVITNAELGYNNSQCVAQGKLYDYSTGLCGTAAQSPAIVQSAVARCNETAKKNNTGSTLTWLTCGPEGQEVYRSCGSGFKPDGTSSCNLEPVTFGAPGSDTPTVRRVASSQECTDNETAVTVGGGRGGGYIECHSKVATVETQANNSDTIGCRVNMDGILNGNRCTQVCPKNSEGKAIFSYDLVKKTNVCGVAEVSANTTNTPTSNTRITSVNTTSSDRDVLIQSYEALTKNGIEIKTINVDNCSTSTSCFDYKDYIDLNDLQKKIEANQSIVNAQNQYAEIIKEDKNAFSGLGYNDFHTKYSCESQKLECVKVKNGFLGYSYLSVDQLEEKAAELKLDIPTVSIPASVFEAPESSDSQPDISEKNKVTFPNGKVDVYANARADCKYANLAVKDPSSGNWACPSEAEAASNTPPKVESIDQIDLDPSGPAEKVGNVFTQIGDTIGSILSGIGGLIFTNHDVPPAETSQSELEIAPISNDKPSSAQSTVINGKNVYVNPDTNKWYNTSGCSSADVSHCQSGYCDTVKKQCADRP